jgi:hypothetical protein
VHGSTLKFSPQKSNNATESEMTGPSEFLQSAAENLLVGSSVPVNGVK